MVWRQNPMTGRNHRRFENALCRRPQQVYQFRFQPSTASCPIREFKIIKRQQRKAQSPRRAERPSGPSSGRNSLSCGTEKGCHKEKPILLLIAWDGSIYLLTRRAETAAMLIWPMKIGHRALPRWSRTGSHENIGFPCHASIDHCDGGGFNQTQRGCPY